LGNFAAFLCILAGYLFKAIFFGTLRTIEVEVRWSSVVHATQGTWLMMNTSGSGDHSALLRQIMVLCDGIYASIDLFPASNKVMERWQWSVLTRSLNHRLVTSYLRDDFNPPFIALFAVLYFLRSFHWIAGDRIDYVSQLNLS
jgi:hypothetical protein